MGREGFRPELESLRGIAAFGVAWTHSNMVFTPHQAGDPALMSAKNWIFTLIPAGASVVLFFALSGYVLGLALMRDSNYVRFATRRLFRILPAMWVAVIITFLLTTQIPIGLPKGTYHPWFQNVFLQTPTWADLGRNLVLAKRSIDPVIWTLLPEIVCSLVLPALIYLHLRVGIWGRIALLVGLAVMGHFASDSALQYLVTFYAGFLIPSVIVPRSGKWYVALALVAAGWALLCVGNAYGVPYNPSMRETCTLGAVLMISGVVAAPHLMGVLRTAPLRFMGRVSFSFYLLHLPTLYALSIIVSRVPSLTPVSGNQTFVLSVASILFAFAAAALCYRYVETPAIALGRCAADSISHPAERPMPAE